MDRNTVWIKLAFVFLAALSWSVGLVSFRVLWTGSLDYAFLVFNLALAFIPLLFSCAFVMAASWKWRALFAGGWLLFFPNAPYILTDLVHLQNLTGAPAWFDVLMLSSCAITALAMGFTSLAQIHRGFLRINRPWLGWAAAGASCFLAGFGIYLGRFLRWHSVHFLTNPLEILFDLGDRLINPLSHPRTWGVTIGFGMLLFLSYAMILLLGRVLPDLQAQASLEKQER